ncbi:prepilin-type N-terminal cleavage/methylation domain-containing protein [Thermomonas brevis]|uniref:Prepilin-type N-terminal cleavage/methylation domain-containing protein n=1 Tax=Thermomonas brevis TaxID=215691 RepID=A0A7G9QUV6_9GAMM|nr:prepilin-type N-terminal cleavage/methylation domain-containing protein [Thermomonas brevis]
MSRSRQVGFGLIELMVAMMLGLLVLGAAVAVFQSNLRTFNANDGQNRVQENARVAYELLSKDVRSTGSSACSAEASVLGTDSMSNAFKAPCPAVRPSSPLCRPMTFPTASRRRRNPSCNWWKAPLTQPISSRWATR